MDDTAYEIQLCYSALMCAERFKLAFPDATYEEFEAYVQRRAAASLQPIAEDIEVVDGGIYQR